MTAALFHDAILAIGSVPLPGRRLRGTRVGAGLKPRHYSDGGSLGPVRFDRFPRPAEERPVRQLFLARGRRRAARSQRIAVRRLHAQQVVDEVVPLLASP